MADNLDLIARASRAAARAMELKSRMELKRHEMRETAEALGRQREEYMALQKAAHRQLESLTALSRTLHGQLGARAKRLTSDVLEPGQHGEIPAPADDGGGAMIDLLTETDRKTLDLEELMRGLDAHGIRSGVHTSDEGMLAWVSDRDYRQRRDGVIRRTDWEKGPGRGATAEWLHQAALQLFPDGQYARLHQVAEKKGSGATNG